MSGTSPPAAPSGTGQVARDTLFYMVAALLPQAAAFLLLPVYSRFLSPDDYGLLGLIMAFTTFLPLLWTFQIGGSLPRFFFEHTEEALGTFLTTITAAVVAASLLGMALTWLLLPVIIAKFFPGVSPSQHALFAISLISTFFQILSSHFAILLRSRRKARLFMILSVSVFALGIILNVLEVVVFRRGARGMVEAGAWTALFNCIAFASANLKLFTPRLDPGMLRAPIAYSLPLIPHTLAGLVFLYSDRLILARYVPLAALGLYTFSDRVAGLFKLAVNELNGAFQPHFFHSAMRDRDAAAKEARDIARATIILTTLGVSALALFATEAVDLCFDERFFSTWKMIPLLASGWVFRSLYAFATSGLFFDKKTGNVALITAISAAVNMVANFLLVPRYGVWAALGSTVAAYWSTYLMAVLFSRGHYFIPLDTRVNTVFITYMYAAIAASFWLNEGYVPGSLLPAWAYAAKLCVLALGVGLWMLMDRSTVARLIAYMRKR